MKDEKAVIESGEPQIETLIQAPYRFEVEHESTKKVEPLTFKQLFKPIKKDEELESIIKAILP